MSNPAQLEGAQPTRTEAFEKRLKQRYASERRFKRFGLLAILVSIAILFILLGNMTINGIGGFQRAELQVGEHVFIEALEADLEQVRRVENDCLSEVR